MGIACVQLKAEEDLKLASYQAAVLFMAAIAQYPAVYWLADNFSPETMFKLNLVKRSRCASRKTPTTAEISRAATYRDGTRHSQRLPTLARSISSHVSSACCG